MIIDFSAFREDNRHVEAWCVLHATQYELGLIVGAKAHVHVQVAAFADECAGRIANTEVASIFGAKGVSAIKGACAVGVACCTIVAQGSSAVRIEGKLLRGHGAAHSVTCEREALGLLPLWPPPAGGWDVGLDLEPPWIA